MYACAQSTAITDELEHKFDSERDMVDGSTHAAVQTALDEQAALFDVERKELQERVSLVQEVHAERVSKA